MTLITTAMALVRKWPCLRTLPLFGIASALEVGTEALKEQPELLQGHGTAIERVQQETPRVFK